MTDINAHPSIPDARPSSTPQMQAVVEAPTTKSNSALTTLKTLGALLSIGGIITMIVGITRKAPRGRFTSAAEDIQSLVQFAGTSTLIVLSGAVALLLGGMALVGSLTVAAINSSK